MSEREVGRGGQGGRGGDGGGRGGRGVGGGKARAERIPVGLTIAGSDSGGGAGIQADLKTFHAFGVFGTSAVTAITVQNTRGVFDVLKVDPSIVAAQIETVCEDLKPDACKTGMLADDPIIRRVAAALDACGDAPVVVDPVMVATSGDRLLEAEAVTALCDALIPRATVVTPNLPEAEILSGIAIDGADEMRRAAERIRALGCEAVLLKGGHLEADEVLDILYDGAEWHEWRAARLDTTSTHGTGCTLSAALASGLARGLSLRSATDLALGFTRRALETAPGLGGGNGPLNHWADVIAAERDAT